jgi:hypothetical protein
MTRDDIIRMAREADLVSWMPNATFSDGCWWIEAHEPDDCLQRFAALVAAPLEERIQDLYRQIEALEKQLDDQYKLGMEAERDHLLSTEIHSCHANCERFACVQTRRAVEAERVACWDAAGIALLGADRDLTKRVLKAIAARGQQC